MKRLGPMCPACGLFRLGSAPDWRVKSIYVLAAICPTCAFRERHEQFFWRDRALAKLLTIRPVFRDAAE